MPLFRLVRPTAVGLIAVAASACDLLDSEPIFCTGEFVSGLHVSVQDSVTGAPTASGAQLIARDGAYADTATVPPAAPNPDAWVLLAAGERPGVYVVTVRKAGFATWERTGVEVTADECHVRPVALTARLQRVP
jgi:hypothetical protein